MDEQQRVEAFIDEHELHATPPYRVLDLAAEVGELAKDCNETSGYGQQPEDATVSTGELGDVLFCVLALAVEADVDAGVALEDALAKYEERMAEGGSPGSGSHDS